MGEFAVGQPVPRFEDPRLLRGGGRYVDDMVLPRMTFGHVLRSPHAHARLRAIDVGRAKAATEVAFAGADHVVKRRLVINRVTAAAMEPRGSIGDFNPRDGRYTIYTTLQRTHSYRAELAGIIGVPESRVRVVCGDIGGSFGMKSAIYNEVALVLLASKVVGRPVKWTSTRSEAFLSDAQARDHVTEAELALDKDGHFLGLRVKTIAAVGAYPQ